MMNTPMNEQIAEIMTRFDWSRVLEVMRLLNWTWASTRDGGVPNLQDLQRVAQGLLENCAQAYEESEDWIFFKTGGFAARVYKTTDGPLLELSFEVTSADFQD